MNRSTPQPANPSHARRAKPRHYSRLRRAIRWTALVCAALLVLGVAVVAAINLAMVQATNKRLVSVSEAAELGAAEPFDAILVLGAGLYADGRPMPMLASRIETGAELYLAGAAPVVLASGDNSRAEYNEVAAMHRGAVAAGLPAKDVYLDYAGFSTYESIYRARDVFGARRILIVTQAYHLPRALHDARALGLEAYGVAAEPHSNGQGGRDLREVAARVKDWVWGLFKPEPTFLGPKVELKPGAAPDPIETPSS